MRLLHISIFILFIQTGCGKLVAQQMSEFDRQRLKTSLTKLHTAKLSNREKIRHIFEMGLIHNRNGNTDSARFYLRKALSMPGGQEYQGGRIIVNIANSYAFEGKYSEALKYYLEALNVAENTKSPTERSNGIRAMANISECYYDIGNYGQAFYYAEQALKEYERTGALFLEYILPQIYYIIGSVYLERGELELSEKNMSKTYHIADAIYQHSRNSGGILIYKSYGMEGLARVYLNRKEYARALDCAEQAFTYAEQDDNVLGMAKASATLSDISLEQRLYEDSRKYALKAIEVNSSAIEQNPRIAFNLGVVEMFTGEKEQAYPFFQTYSNQIRRNTDRNFREIMASMEVKYETQKKELRIAALEEERKLYIGLCIAIVATLLLAMGLLFYRHRLFLQEREIAEQQIKQLEQEKELIAVRSALETEKAEREHIARDLHDGVGAMLSVVKNNMNIIKSYSIIENKEVEYFNKALDGLDKSIVELRRVAHHIMPSILLEKGLFAALDDFCRSIPNAGFHYSAATERRFDSEKELMLYRCAYELVSNVLRHAGASRIDVHLNMDEETVPDFDTGTP